MSYVLPIAQSITLKRKTVAGGSLVSVGISGSVGSGVSPQDYTYTYTGSGGPITVKLYSVQVLAQSQAGGYCMYTNSGNAVFLLFFGYNNADALFRTTIAVINPGAYSEVDRGYYRYTVNSGTRTYRVTVHNDSSETINVRYGATTYEIEAGDSQAVGATLTTHDDADKYIYLSKPSYSQPPLLVGSSANTYDQTAIFGPWETLNENSDNRGNFYVSDNFPSIGASELLHGEDGAILFGSGDAPVFGPSNPKATPSFPVLIEWTWSFYGTDAGVAAYINGAVVCDNPHEQSHIIPYDLFQLGSSYSRSADGMTYTVTFSAGAIQKGSQWDLKIKPSFEFDGVPYQLQKAATFQAVGVSFTIEIDYDNMTASIT